MALKGHMAVALKREDQTPSGWAISTKRFGDGLEYVLILDTEWGFPKKFPDGLSNACRAPSTQLIEGSVQAQPQVV
jgi:hypothetical protein